MLASTAHWTAAVRARESERPDRLFHDPWAAALAGQEGADWIQQRSAESVIPIIIRTRFFDDFLKRTIADHSIHQGVLMAAGLDTRAFRIDWPQQMHFYELDQAAVLQYKEKILNSMAAKPCCTRHQIAIDLISSWESVLKQAGFDPAQPSVWLLEGFLFYLSNENLTNVLERALSLAAPGSFIGFDMINSITLTSPFTKNWIEMQAQSGAPWIGFMDDPIDFLASRGWKAALTPVGGSEANYHRWTFPVIPALMPNMPHLWFVVAEKADSQRSILQQS